MYIYVINFSVDFLAGEASQICVKEILIYSHGHHMLKKGVAEVVDSFEKGFVNMAIYSVC